VFGGRQAETEMNEGRINRPVGHSGLSAHDRNGARQSPAAIRSTVLIDGDMASPAIKIRCGIFRATEPLVNKKALNSIGYN
jgi:hypothetical protein